MDSEAQVQGQKMDVVVPSSCQPKRYTQEELAQRISELDSPIKIAEFFYHLQTENDRVQAEKEELQASALTMEGRIKELSMVYHKPGTTFTCFPKLPAELRFKIWGFSVPDERLVEIDCGDFSNEFNTFSCPRNHHPSVLHVCKEARREILKLHPLIAEKAGGIPRFFNHSRDVLGVSSDFFNYLMNKQRYEGIEWHWNWTDTAPTTYYFNYAAGFDPLKIRRVAIRTDLWDDYFLINAGKLSVFPMLEEVILISSSYPTRTGKQKLVDLRGEDDVRCRDDAHNGVVIEAAEYGQLAKKVFTDVLDESLFREQFSLALEPLLGVPNINAIPAEKQLNNPWLIAGRTPPHIRVMRMVKDSNDATLEVDYDEN